MQITAFRCILLPILIANITGVLSAQIFQYDPVQGIMLTSWRVDMSGVGTSNNALIPVVPGSSIGSESEWVGDTIVGGQSGVRFANSGTSFHIRDNNDSTMLQVYRNSDGNGVTRFSGRTVWGPAKEDNWGLVTFGRDRCFFRSGTVYGISKNLALGTPGDTNALIINQGGRVGVGTGETHTSTTPIRAKLHIVGEGSTVTTTSLLVENSQGSDILRVLDNGELHTAGQVTANGVVLTSDRKFKSDVLAINDPLSRLMALEGVTYRFKSTQFPDMHFPEGRQIGLIAQEVEVHFPDLVHELEHDGKPYKGVDYVGLIPVLIEANKLLAERVATLEKRLGKTAR